MKKSNQKSISIQCCLANNVTKIYCKYTFITLLYFIFVAFVQVLWIIMTYPPSQICTRELYLEVDSWSSFSSSVFFSTSVNSACWASFGSVGWAACTYTRERHGQVHQPYSGCPGRQRWGGSLIQHFNFISYK